MIRKLEMFKLEMLEIGNKNVQIGMVLFGVPAMPIDWLKFHDPCTNSVNLPTGVAGSYLIALSQAQTCICMQGQWCSLEKLPFFPYASIFLMHMMCVKKCQEGVPSPPSIGRAPARNVEIGNI